MNENKLEQARKEIEGYKLPPQRINKFSLNTFNEENTETVRQDILHKDEYTEEMKREIRAKYNPEMYQHPQNPVSSIQPVYATLISTGSLRHRSEASKLWRKKSKEDTASVMIYGIDWISGSFRKHMLPIQIRHGKEFIFSSDSYSKDNRMNYLRLYQDCLSVETNYDWDKISKEGFRDKPTKEGNELFGRPALSPQEREFRERARALGMNRDVYQL